MTETPLELRKLEKAGVSLEQIRDSQVLCLPENLLSVNGASDAIDNATNITICKILREEGIRVANSLDLDIETKVVERRGDEIWLGAIWVMERAVLPVVVGVVGKCIYDKLNKRKRVSEKDVGTEVHLLQINDLIKFKS